MIAMNLKNRFRLVIFCMVALLASMAAVVSVGLRHTSIHVQESIGMDELADLLYELQILNSEYLSTPSERVKQQWRTKYDQVNIKLVEQYDIPSDVTEALEGLQHLFVRLTSLPDASPDMETSQKRIRNQLATTLNLESQRIIDWASSTSRHTKDTIVLHLFYTGAVTLSVMLVVALVVITIMLITTRHILSSVNRLKKGAEEIASGKLGVQVEQAGNDEVASLATAINQMSRSLMDSYGDLQRQTVQLETEMAERQVLYQALKIKTVELENEIEKRKRADEKLRDTLESLRKSMSTAIQVMVATVEARDPYTAGHQIRSADLARAIATEMGLPREKIEGLRMAGSIHDIGKISIPAEILSKPTKLSEIEFSLIKAHAQIGYEMLKDVESSWPLAEIVYQHHERMDGSGYPRHLKGDDICIEARILCVADVVEAMASHRPYRAGLGIDAALNEIERNRGIFYDAAVADACLRLFREKGFRLEEAHGVRSVA